jgi:hypothetical protein
VVGFFRANRRGLGAWPTLVAPLLGMAGLVAMIVLVVRNFELLTARGTTTNWLLIGAAVAVFSSGVVLGVLLRRRRPATYAGLGSVGVE